MLSISIIVAICLLFGYTIGGDMGYIASSGFRTVMWISAVGMGAFIGSRLSTNVGGGSALVSAMIGAACSVIGTALAYWRRKKT